MTTINEAIEFTVPTWSLCYFINGDRDGYTEGDLQLLDSFVQKLADEYGNAALMLPPDEMCDSYFSWRNDVHSLGDTVTTLYLQPTI
jgi:hypothetical protein